MSRTSSDGLEGKGGRDRARQVWKWAGSVDQRIDSWQLYSGFSRRASQGSRKALKPEQCRADVKEVAGLELGLNVQELAYIEQRTGVGQLGLEELPCPSPLLFPQPGPPQLGLSLPHSLPVSPSCLEFLLDNGADPSLRDRQGYTAVHYAAAYGNRQNLELVRVGSGLEQREQGAQPPLCLWILKPRGG